MANSYLTRTPSSAGNRKKFTISFWVKRSGLGSSNNIFSATNDASSSNARFYVLFGSGDDLMFKQYDGSSINFDLTTNRFFRDTNAWYHIVYNFDSDNGTANLRQRIWVNGVEETSFSARTNPSSSYDSFVNQTKPHNIGNDTNVSSRFFDGYISHFSFVDGQALAPTVFGETDSTSGIWKFKSPSGVTWGTNGFHLKFENSGALGTDSSGNSNTFAVNGNLKQALDTPSNVHATLNPNDVMKQSSAIYAPTFSNGNLTMASDDNQNRQTFATISPETGKWYWEMKIDVANTTGHRLGVFFGNNKTHSGSYYYGSDAFYIHQNGEIYYNGSSTTYMASYTANDIISVALDVTNGNIYMSKNGGASDSTWADGSGNNNQAFPGTSVNGKLSASWISGLVTPFFDVYGTGNKQSINFGNGFFGTTAITSAGSNGNGSLFEYDVPSGYYALNTKNINTYG